MESSPQMQADAEKDVGIFANELSALMLRHGIFEFAQYAQTSAGAVLLSYSSSQALVHAYSAFHEKYMSILGEVTPATPLQA